MVRKISNKCPICNNEIISDDYYDDHILLESKDECKKCGKYCYYYAYGNSEIFIENQSFYFYNSMSLEENNKICSEIKLAEKIARKNYLSGNLMRLIFNYYVKIFN